MEDDIMNVVKEGGALALARLLARRSHKQAAMLTLLNVAISRTACIERTPHDQSTCVRGDQGHQCNPFRTLETLSHPPKTISSVTNSHPLTSAINCGTYPH